MHKSHLHLRSPAWLSLVVMAASIAAPNGSAAKDSANVDVRQLDPAALERVMGGLVQQLGSEEYARREKAQAELRILGLAAFDALHKAQDSEDIEIALRARYLLRSMTTHWAHEDDPMEVKGILRGYGGKSPEERKNLLEQLGALPDGQGVSALCRLVRFETSNTLSKQAALLVMHQSSDSDGEVQTGVAETINREIGLSRRTGAEWLRTYVATLNEPDSVLDQWERISRKEEHVFHHSPEKSDPLVVRDLLRWQADLLKRVDRVNEAEAVMRRTVDLVDGTRVQLLETVDWMMEREAWSIIEEMAGSFRARFEENAVLLYRVAELQVRRGEKELAQETADRAAKTNPDNHQEHVEAGYSLQERGLFQWSEREYRQVTKLAPPGSLDDLRARFLLSEMLHDLHRELMAAQTLQAIVDIMDKDKNVVYNASRIRRDPGSIRSRMHFFYAEHSRAEGDAKKQKEHLQEGVQSDPTDADVLIAMYRMDGADEPWKTTTREHIKKAVQGFRVQIREYALEVAGAASEELRAYYRRELASANNQLAWLVGNTEGDYDEAVRCSQKSLELRPNTSGYLDTLGRCYYAKGDYANAVKHQSRAVELDPHSGQIRRQLELFQQALDASLKPKK